MLNNSQKSLIYITATVKNPSQDTVITSVDATTWEPDRYDNSMTWPCYGEATKDLEYLMEHELSNYGALWNTYDIASDEVKAYYGDEYDEYYEEELSKWPETYYINQLKDLYIDIDKDIDITPIMALHKVCGFYARHTNVVFTCDYKAIDVIL